MVSSTSPMVIILLWYLCATTLYSSMSHGNLDARCSVVDREAFEIFKRSIEDPLKQLSSWSSEEDCCKWYGVQCDNLTGRVIKLDLQSSYLGGQINFILLKLDFLSYLDLHDNQFEAIHIPPIHGSAHSQRSHNMSLTTTLHHDTYFSNLLFLDLSSNNVLHMDNLRWVSQLSSLKYLNLSEIDLSKETLWLQRVTMLPSLLELRLSFCFLNNIQPSLGFVNFSSLEVLDISANRFHTEIPKWLFSLNSSISYLDLASNNLRGQIPKAMSNFRHLKSIFLNYNHLNGSIPKWMGQYKQLEHLDLSFNLFCGPIPETMGNLSSLTYLDVGYNQLNGSLPKSLLQLSNLQRLSVGYNSLSGILSEQSFSKLSKLKILELDSSAFTFDMGSQWHPPFQLEGVSMSFCKLGPKFPSWLYTQRSLSYLYIPSSGLPFNFQEKFWNFVAKIDDLDLSNNSISGEIPSLLINNTSINLNSNKFRGKLPHLSQKVTHFDIANNSFSGLISSLLCQTMNGNQELIFLRMSHNLLSGELPNCWMHWQSLEYVYLESNNFTGKIPSSMGSLIKLQTLSLRDNHLFGKPPASLQNCKELWLLDLGFNEFSGNISSWISHSTTALLLRSNNFGGNIPSQICQLSRLIVLDLADNKFSGRIPKCLYNIRNMVTFDSYEDLEVYIHTTSSFWEAVRLFVKGQEYDYLQNFRFARILDLSNNNLSGLIPQELFRLVLLQFLNLSHNQLMGNIPDDIGHMKFLESLDLSENQLVGKIPQSMTNLSFLGHLNLSYNNFIGRIPLGTQLQSFNASCYMGNLGLCGAPLTKNCSQGEISNGKNHIEGSDDEFTRWFYIGMGVGFAFEFWGVCSTLFFIRTWRHAYFRFLNDMSDRIYVFIALKANWFG